jgi:general secretion pathway protein M
MLLVAAAALVLAAVLYLSLIEPALTARKRISAELPGLRAQVEDMRRQEKEIAVLRKKIAAASRQGDLKETLQASARRTSFVNAVEGIEPQADGKVRLRVAPAVFDDWLAWTESLQREFGVRLEDCKVSATDRPGMVRVDATFAQAGESLARKTP